MSTICSTSLFGLLNTKCAYRKSKYSIFHIEIPALKTKWIYIGKAQFCFKDLNVHLSKILQYCKKKGKEFNILLQLCKTQSEELYSWLSTIQCTQKQLILPLNIIAWQIDWMSRRTLTEICLHIHSICVISSWFENLPIESYQSWFESFHSFNRCLAFFFPKCALFHFGNVMFGFFCNTLHTIQCVIKYRIFLMPKQISLHSL